MHTLLVAAAAWLVLACLLGPLVGRRLRRNNQTTRGSR